MNKDQSLKIPSVDYILNHPLIKDMNCLKDHSVKKHLIKTYIKEYKEQKGLLIQDKDLFVKHIREFILDKLSPKLKKVINATGILLHTNLGRAPLSEHIVKRCIPTITRYSNLEFDCESSKRGDRNSHLKNIINLLTSAEDCLVVNNNAAAIFLCLNQFAGNKEVLISRSELIEIGGNFRIPDILKSAGSILKEVGTTNCTRIEDYSSNISDNTALIFKAHQSNYYIAGHTETTPLSSLTQLARDHNVPFIYDIGSGLIKKIDSINSPDELSVKDAIEAGCDLVTFSTDKLLGGPQAGVIVGKKEFIQALSKNPLMRVLRVDKITISILFECLKMYLNEDIMNVEMPFFKFISKNTKQLRNMAKRLVIAFKNKGIEASIIKDIGRTGGGTLPSIALESFSVQLSLKDVSSEALFSSLMKDDCPIIALLKEGKISFNVLALFDDDINIIAEKVQQKILDLRTH